MGPFHDVATKYAPAFGILVKRSTLKELKTWEAPSRDAHTMVRSLRNSVGLSKISVGISEHEKKIQLDFPGNYTTKM